MSDTPDDSAIGLELDLADLIPLPRRSPEDG